MSSEQLELFDKGPLSAREVEVLTLVSTGNTNVEIGQQLFISPETVKSHIRHILAKTGAESRAHAVALALRQGEIQ